MTTRQRSSINVPNTVRRLTLSQYSPHHSLYSHIRTADGINGNRTLQMADRTGIVTRIIPNLFVPEIMLAEFDITDVSYNGFNIKVSDFIGSALEQGDWYDIRLFLDVFDITGSGTIPPSTTTIIDVTYAHTESSESNMPIQLYTFPSTGYYDVPVGIEIRGDVYYKGDLFYTGTAKTLAEIPSREPMFSITPRPGLPVVEVIDYGINGKTMSFRTNLQDIRSFVTHPMSYGISINGLYIPTQAIVLTIPIHVPSIENTPTLDGNVFVFTNDTIGYNVFYYGDYEIVVRVVDLNNPSNVYFSDSIVVTTQEATPQIVDTVQDITEPGRLDITTVADLPPYTVTQLQNGINVTLEAMTSFLEVDNLDVEIPGGENYQTVSPIINPLLNSGIFFFNSPIDNLVPGRRFRATRAYDIVDGSGNKNALSDDPIDIGVFEVPVSYGAYFDLLDAIEFTPQYVTETGGYGSSLIFDTDPNGDRYISLNWEGNSALQLDITPPTWRSTVPALNKSVKITLEADWGSYGAPGQLFKFQPIPTTNVHLQTTGIITSVQNIDSNVPVFRTTQHYIREANPGVPADHSQNVVFAEYVFTDNYSTPTDLTVYDRHAYEWFYIYDDVNPILSYMRLYVDGIQVDERSILTDFNGFFDRAYTDPNSTGLRMFIQGLGIKIYKYTIDRIDPTIGILPMYGPRILLRMPITINNITSNGYTITINELVGNIDEEIEIIATIVTNTGQIAYPVIYTGEVSALVLPYNWTVDRSDPGINWFPPAANTNGHDIGVYISPTSEAVNVYPQTPNPVNTGPLPGLTLEWLFDGSLAESRTGLAYTLDTGTFSYEPGGGIRNTSEGELRLVMLNTGNAIYNEFNTNWRRNFKVTYRLKVLPTTNTLRFRFSGQRFGTYSQLMHHTLQWFNGDTFIQTWQDVNNADNYPFLSNRTTTAVTALDTEVEAEYEIRIQDNGPSNDLVSFYYNGAFVVSQTTVTAFGTGAKEGMFFPNEIDAEMHIRLPIQNSILRWIKYEQL